MSKVTTRTESRQSNSTTQTIECWLQLESLDFLPSVDPPNDARELQILTYNTASSRNCHDALSSKAARIQAGMLLVRLDCSEEWNWRDEERALIPLIGSSLTTIATEATEILSNSVSNRTCRFSVEFVTSESAVPEEFREGWQVPSSENGLFVSEEVAESSTLQDRQRYAKLIFDKTKPSVKGLNRYLKQLSTRKLKLKAKKLELSVDAINFYVQDLNVQLFLNRDDGPIACSLQTITNNEKQNRLRIGISESAPQPEWDGESFPPLIAIPNGKKGVELETKLGHGGFVELESLRKEPPISPSSPNNMVLCQAFEEATAETLAELPLSRFNAWRAMLDDAQLVKARRLIGVPDDEQITISKINRFFRKCKSQRFTPDETLLLSQLVSKFRSSAKHKLVVTQDGKDVECSLTARIPAKRNFGQIWIRSANEKQESLYCRTELPEGLRFVRE